MKPRSTSTESITVNLSPMLARHTAGQRVFTVGASSVREAIEGVTREAPALRAAILTPENICRGFVNVYLDDRDTRWLGGLDTPCADGAVVTLLAAVAGG